MTAPAPVNAHRLILVTLLLVAGIGIKAAAQDAAKHIASGGDESPGAEAPATGTGRAAQERKVHIHSPFQPSPRAARILTPALMPASKRIVYLLPVESTGSHAFGSALDEVKKLDLANRYGVVFAEPDFAQTPWYADHPSDPEVRQESHLVKAVIEGVERELGWTDTPVRRYLVGFSKSGWGALVLLFRHPDVFRGAAAWDAPLMTSAPKLWGMDEIFGTQENFDGYRFTRSVPTPTALRDRTVILAGHGIFREQMLAAHEFLTAAGVAHQFQDGPNRQHRWDGGWLEDAVQAVLGDSSNTYTNPIGDPPVAMGDPAMLRHDGRYYLFGTTKTSEGFEYYTSEDLVHWSYGGWAWRKTESSWATALFWAPEVCEYRGRFYLVYSGRVRDGEKWQMRMGLAVSDAPEGPYRDLHAPWFDFGYSAIDGHIFVDGDDRPYLYFSRNGSQDGYSYGAICGVALADDLSTPLGEPLTLLEASQPWERVNWSENRCNEAPAVIKHHDTYYMTYSANRTNTADYGIGTATARSPLGPWTKYEGNPIAASDLSIGVSGPGHNSIIRSPDGRELFMVYHAHEDPTAPRGPRVVCIDRIFFDAKGNLRLNGPTRSPQPIPGGIR